MFCGIDWASQTHAVCVLDQAGRKVSAFQVPHTAEGFQQLTGRLRRLGDPSTVPVAIERPDGRLVDLLLEAGHPVVPVQPAAIAAWRKAEVPSGAKHDPSDAATIADYLRLRRHKLRELVPFSAHTRALRAVVRTRDDLVDQRVAATNQLSACLEAFWPGARHLFADIESAIALAFLARYPTPEAAGGLDQRRMQAFLTKHGYCGRRPAAELLKRLRAAPAGLTGTVEVEARRDAVLALVGVLRALNSAIKDLDRSIVAHLGEHPDGPIFTSLPRSGRINAAQVLAEGATAGQLMTLPTPWPAWPAPPRSPDARASTPRSASAGRATSGSARRSRPWPTTPATPRRGRPRSTPTRSRVALTIPTPSACSPGPGSGCSGAAGSTRSPTTPAATATPTS